MVEHRRVDLSPVVAHHFALDDIQEAYSLFSERRDGVLKVALYPDKWRMPLQKTTAMHSSKRCGHHVGRCPMSLESKWSSVVFLALTVVSAACGSKSPSEPTPTPCSYTVSPSTLSFDAAGGSESVTVAAAANCSWTAASDRGWMTITGGSGSTGPGVVGVSVTANTGLDGRSGTLTVAGQTVAVAQQAAVAACTYEIAPVSAAFNNDGGAGTFAVNTAPGCTWTAAPNTSWISVSAPSATVTGSGTVSFSVTRNTELGARSGAIAAGGRAFTISQSGDTGVCEYRVGPVEFSPCMAASQVTTTITTSATCPWTVASDSAWLSIAGGSSGTGSATITVTVAENWDAPRAGIVMVRWPTPTAGQNVRVAQAGCRYSVTFASIDVVAAGGPAQFGVYQQSDPYTCGGPLQNACMWIAQADVPWIHVITSMPQYGDNPQVRLTVDENTGSPRSGSVRVRDQIVRINQAGR